MEPITRVEQYLAKIEQNTANGGGGGGGGGIKRIDFTVVEGAATLDSSFSGLVADVEAGVIPYIIKFTDFGGDYTETDVLFLAFLNENGGSEWQATFAAGSTQATFTAEDATSDMTNPYWG